METTLLMITVGLIVILAVLMDSRKNKQIQVTGALTGKKILIPRTNFGMVMEIAKDEFKYPGLYKEYPPKFTRICFKERLSDGTKFADCRESFRKVTRQI